MAFTSLSGSLTKTNRDLLTRINFLSFWRHRCTCRAQPTEEQAKAWWISIRQAQNTRQCSPAQCGTFSCTSNLSYSLKRAYSNTQDQDLRKEERSLSFFFLSKPGKLNPVMRSQERAHVLNLEIDAENWSEWTLKEINALRITCIVLAVVYHPRQSTANENSLRECLFDSLTTVEARFPSCALTYYLWRF